MEEQQRDAERPSGTILSQSRSYDNASNVISLTTTQAAVPNQSGSGGSETQNFCYDEQNRLVWAGNSGTQPAAGNGTCGTATLSNTLSGASYTNSYVYTHLGQLWQGPLAGGSTPYQYLYCGSNNHLLTGLYPLGTTCSTQSGAVYTSNYDAFGNVTSRTYSGTTATLSYDNLDHFTEWNAGSTNREWYVYDGAGNRVLRRTINSTSTTMRVYAFGLEEHKYGSAGANLSNTYYYLLGGRLLGALDGNGTTFYLTDALGSVLSSFNTPAGSAVVKGNQVFGPYGNARDVQGTINTAKGFTGQYNDSLTGLDYYNARYYDSVVGVFLSADSKQGNMQGMNPYAYVGGNPETFNDPTGQTFAPPPGGSYGPTDDFGAPMPPPQIQYITLFSSIDPATYRAPRVAADLARRVKAYRTTRSDRQNSYDMGAGVWYLTDAEGNLMSNINFITQFPVKGSDATGHAEEKLLKWWLNFKADGAISALLEALADGKNAQLHVVLFTQLPPCPGCQNYFHDFMQTVTTEMNTMLAERMISDPLFDEDFPAPPYPVMTLDVFGSTYAPIKPNRTSTSQAVWPGTTASYGITDYWNANITFGPFGAFLPFI